MSPLEKRQRFEAETVRNNLKILRGKGIEAPTFDPVPPPAFDWSAEEVLGLRQQALNRAIRHLVGYHKVNGEWGGPGGDWAPHMHAILDALFLHQKQLDETQKFLAELREHLDMHIELD